MKHSVWDESVKKKINVLKIRSDSCNKIILYYKNTGEKFWDAAR